MRCLLGGRGGGGMGDRRFFVGCGVNSVCFCVCERCVRVNWDLATPKTNYRVGGVVPNLTSRCWHFFLSYKLCKREPFQFQNTLGIDGRTLTSVAPGCAVKKYIFFSIFFLFFLFCCLHQAIARGRGVRHSAGTRWAVLRAKVAQAEERARADPSQTLGARCVMT